MRITSNRYTGKHKPLFAVMLCAAALTLSIISCGDAYYDVLHGNMTNMVPSEIRSVTYSGNGSTSGTPPEDTTIYLQGQSVTVLGNTGSLARTGHTLGTPMWNTAPDGTGIDYAPGDSLTMGALGVILYARWDINQYTVSFNTYGGTPVPSPQTVNYGATATQPAPDPSLTGYTFAGWFTDGTYSTVWNFGSMTVSGDTTIHALWTKNQYTVSFDSQGGTPTPAFQPVDYGDCAMDPGTPTRAGYTFIGWFTASTGGSQWNFGSDVVTGNMMLYAHWDGIPYTVTYHPNGDETAGSPPVDGNTYYIGDTVTVLWCGTMRGPTVAGIITQRLLGWSMTYGGSVDYEPGATFALGSASVDLYAKWTTDTNVIGKVGPAGGYIFYDDAADVYPGWRYLEAAPEDLPASWPWGCKSSPTPTGATDTAIGSGPTLTAIIISQCGSANASGQCDAYTLNGYSDWFLPSLNELQQLRLNLTSPGRAAYKITEGGPYWSSTEGYWGDNYHGDYMELDDGGYVVQQWKENPELVRPVRRFE